MTVDEFKSVFSKVLKLKDVTLSEVMGKTRGWDSLRHIQLILEIERSTSVRVPPEMFGVLNSAQALLGFLRENGALEEA